MIKFKFTGNTMKCLESSLLVLLSLLTLLNQIPTSFSFISKGTVESVSGKLVRPVYRTAKISRLFSTKQLLSNSSSTTPWPIEIDTKATIINSSSTKEPKPQALVQDPIVTSDHSKVSVYNRSSNSLISSETWKDLNMVLSEDDMKRFLTTLPLHTLRSLTALTKKSPELGQKQLLRLILDRSHRLKLNKSPDQSDVKDSLPKNVNNVFPSEIQQSGSIPTYLNMENLSSKLDQMKKYLTSTSTPTLQETTEVDSTLNPSTLTTPSLVIDPPYNILRRPTTSVMSEIDTSQDIVRDSDRKHRFLTLPQSVPTEMSPTNNVKVIMMGSPNSHDDETNVIHNDPRQLMNSFNLNSGYYIPPLTSTESPNVDKSSVAASSDHSQIHDSSSRYHPQDPENTFHPNVDTFLRPPLTSTNDLSLEAQSSDQTDSLQSPSSSSVWVPTNKPAEKPPSLKEEERSVGHPFLGFNSNTKLQQAESQDHENEYFSQFNTHGQQHSPPFTIPDESNRFRKPPNSDYNYVHSTVHSEPPKHTYKVIASSDHQENNNYVQNIPAPTYHNIQQSMKTNEDSYKSQVEHLPTTHFSQTHEQPFHHQNSIEIKHNANTKPQFSSTFSLDSPHHQSTPSESPGGHSSSGGWQYIGEGGHHDLYSSHHELGMWDKVKTYFSSGKKSKAEKVFEISIAILSFLAFGGYLVMLIYQVLLVSSTVPLFPLLSTTVPQNPTLIGLLLGRGMNSSPQFDLKFPGKEVAEKYINELEVVVKQAMEKVKQSLEGKPVKVKGDLGH